MRVTRQEEEEAIETEAEEDERFQNAHGTVMIIAWIVFASTAIMFARYSRKVRFGSKDKILGEAIWFQLHRILACLTTIATLLGFFLILVQTGATWVESDEGLEFVHSVLGGIIVACALVQAWMALFRCHPESSFRFIFNWLHRITGSLAFFLSIPTIFTIAVYLDKFRIAMIVILSVWSTWVVLIVIVMEIIQIRINRLNSAPAKVTYGFVLDNFNNRIKTERKIIENTDEAFWSKRIFFLIILHFLVSVGLATPLVVFLWV